jgi:hypothetical protein
MEKLDGDRFAGSNRKVGRKAWMILLPYRKIILRRGRLALIALSAFAVAVCRSSEAQAQQKITSDLTKSLPKYNAIHGLVSDMTLLYTKDGPVEMFFGDLHFDYDSTVINAASAAKLMDQVLQREPWTAQAVTLRPAPNGYSEANAKLLGSKASHSTNTSPI